MLALLLSPRNFKHQGKNGIMMFTKFLVGREHGIHEYPANILIRHLTDYGALGTEQQPRGAPGKQSKAKQNKKKIL